MRIISGKFKGRIISFLKNSTTRPLKDTVKENIFNILKHSNLIKVKIENSYILDLYSGVGSFGIECISRGSKKVTFIEHDKTASNILKKNLNNLSITTKSKVYNDQIEKVFSKEFKDKYNIFIFDPPCKNPNFIHNLELIKKNKLFYKNHSVIIHREKNSDDKFDNILKIIKIKIYGRSKIIFGEFN